MALLPSRVSRPSPSRHPKFAWLAGGSAGSEDTAVCDSSTSLDGSAADPLSAVFGPRGTRVSARALTRAGIHAGQANEGTSMNKLIFAAASGAALLAVASFANAQGTETGSSSSGAASNQCWDLSSNVVRDRSGTNATGPSGESGRTVGSTTSPGSSSSTGSGASGSGATSSSANAAGRPPGMPNC